MSQDLFVEDIKLQELVELLEKRREGETIKCKTEFMFVGKGETYDLRIIECDVLSYEKEFRIFNLENKELGIRTTRSRFNL